MKRIYVLVDTILTDEFGWELHVLPLLQGYIDSSGIEDITVEQITSLHEIQTLYQNKLVSNKDTFICTNGWSSMIPYIKHLAEINRLSPRILTFWTNGCFNGTDETFRPLNDRNWRKVYERAHFRCSDKSFFISDYFKEQFRIYVSKYVFPVRLNVIPFPLEYMNGELSLYKERFFKTDILVFPWRNFSKMQEQIVYDFIRVFRDKQVIFAQEDAEMPRDQLLTQIARAKCVFLPYTSPTIGKEIYECLSLGAIPIVPDHEGFRDILPKEFLYPIEWTNTIFNYCSNAMHLTDKVTDLIENYGNYVGLIHETEQKMLRTRFDSTEFIQEIFN